jgi:hypothetical protein
MLSGITAVAARRSLFAFEAGQDELPRAIDFEGIEGEGDLSSCTKLNLNST